jgi:putative ABC transport system permease protein
MESLIQDVRYGFRMLVKNPGFTAVAVITLALGIGTNTAMFSVINSVLLRSLPFRDSSRVMLVWKTMSNGTPNAFSTPAFLEIRQQGDFLAHLGAFSNVSFNLVSKDLPERIAGGRVNFELFPVLGVQPILGRTFAAEEDHPGAGQVVILSHALWETRFGSAHAILGSAVTLDGAPIAIDATVLAYTALLCGVVGILFGVAPALEASRVNVSEALKEGARGSSGGFGKHRVILVITETALASMLLIGAGLSLKSLWRAESVDPGFNPSGELTFRIAAPSQFRGERIPLFYQQVLERVRVLPGVQSAVLARNLPMSGGDPSMAIAIEGTPPPPSQIPIVTRLRAIGPDYFSSLQTSLLSGREFTEHDTTAAPKAAIVSESLAKLYWPKESALGKRLRPELPGGEWYTVVGVAADVRHWAADVDIEPTAYYPYTQWPEAFLPMLEGSMTIAVRSNNAGGLLSSIRTAVGDVDRTVPVFDVKSMEEMVSDSGSLRRFDMWLIGAFAALALTLAGLGIYGVMAYSVSQRTREIGIRVALGAQGWNVLRLIMEQGAKLALAGVVVGLVGAFALTRVMASLLYGVSPTDLGTFSLVPLMVLALILVGCYIPARRATKLDPVVAIREE